MEATRKFRATIFSVWKESNPLVLDLFSFLCEQMDTSSVKPSPNQSPLIASLSPFSLLLELFVFHSRVSGVLGVFSLCTTHSGRKPGLVRHSVPPRPVQSSCSSD